MKKLWIFKVSLDQVNYWTYITPYIIVVYILQILLAPEEITKFLMHREIASLRIFTHTKK